MKGIVFTEFLEMVEAKHSLTMADTIVSNANLPSGGTYTAVGTYPVEEMVSLLMALSRETKEPIPALLNAFGKHLFARFVEGFPQFFAQPKSAFEFLEGVDGYIHIEVRKLYPDAELPRFVCARPDATTLIMDYTSPRGLADLAQGLLEACAAHYGESITVGREDRSGGKATDVRFTLRKTPA